jgi:hypothetical protein
MSAYDPKRTLDFEAFDQDQIQSRPARTIVSGGIFDFILTDNEDPS